jgi:hypothetical protein
MKNFGPTFKIVSIGLLSTILFFNCSKKTPKACVTFTQGGKDVTNGTALLTEDVEFKSCGEGDKFSVWPGDSLHVYGTTGTGFDLSQGLSGNAVTYKYKYPKAGKYTVTAVATYIDDKEVNLATKEYTIEIVP